MPIEQTARGIHEPTPPPCPTAEALEKVAQIERGKPDTFGATPLDRALAYDQQFELLLQLRQLVETEVPEGISEELVGAMSELFAIRFHGRAVANHENFLSALHSSDDFDHDPVVSEMLHRAKIGHASPAELLITRELLGIRSVELACLTHPYGKQLELLEPMRQAVQKSVELLGGVHVDEPHIHYRAKNVLSRMRWEPDYKNGLFMTRKRDVGIMPDGTIIRERSSFILRGDDERTLSKATLALLQKIDARQDDWDDLVVEVGGLDVIAATLLAAEEYALAIPVSTTIYAFNPATTEAIALRDQQIKEQRREELEAYMESQAPSLMAAIALARGGTVAPQDVDGMLYVGPEHDD